MGTDKKVLGKFLWNSSAKTSLAPNALSHMHHVHVAAAAASRFVSVFVLVMAVFVGILYAPNFLVDGAYWFRVVHACVRPFIKNRAC